MPRLAEAAGVQRLPFPCSEVTRAAHARRGALGGWEGGGRGRAVRGSKAVPPRTGAAVASSRYILV